MPPQLQQQVPVPTAANFHAHQLVWWKEPGRDAKHGDKAAWVISINQDLDQVLIGFYQEPTSNREERTEIVSPRTLRPRQGAR